MRVQESPEASSCDTSHPMDQQLTCVMLRNLHACNPSIRRERWIGVTLLPVYLLLLALSATAQMEGPLHPQAPTPSTDQPALEGPLIFGVPAAPALMETITLPLGWAQLEPALPELPSRVEISTSQHIAVVLDTLVSTRISKVGQVVTFRTPYSILIGNGLEVPPDMEILGHVAEIKRPGRFEKQGVLGIAVDRMHLEPEGSVNLEAHLDVKDMKAQGRPLSDKRHSTDLYNVAIDTVGGTLLGAAIGGAKGAGIGAGAGAAAAILILMSHRGDDVYLEPGTRFSLILDKPFYLSGAAIYAAQQDYLKNRRTPIPDTDSQSGTPGDGIPKLKRRRPQHAN